MRLWSALSGEIKKEGRKTVATLCWGLAEYPREPGMGMDEQTWTQVYCIGGTEGQLRLYTWAV